MPRIRGRVLLKSNAGALEEVGIALCADLVDCLNPPGQCCVHEISQRLERKGHAEDES
jgi:hypothetical protein